MRKLINNKETSANNEIILFDTAIDEEIPSGIKNVFTNKLLRINSLIPIPAGTKNITNPISQEILFILVINKIVERLNNKFTPKVSSVNINPIP